MSLHNLEYNLLKLQHQQSHNVPEKETEELVSVARLVTVLILTVIITVSELVLAQLTHCISLLVLVHQNIYNCLTLIVTCVTRWKGEESLLNTFGWKRMEVVGSLSSLIFYFTKRPLKSAFVISRILQCLSLPSPFCVLRLPSLSLHPPLLSV